MSEPRHPEFCRFECQGHGNCPHWGQFMPKPLVEDCCKRPDLRERWTQQREQWNAAAAKTGSDLPWRIMAPEMQRIVEGKTAAEYVNILQRVCLPPRVASGLPTVTPTMIEDLSPAPPGSRLEKPRPAALSARTPGSPPGPVAETTLTEKVWYQFDRLTMFGKAHQDEAEVRRRIAACRACPLLGESCCEDIPGHCGDARRGAWVLRILQGECEGFGGEATQ